MNTNKFKLALIQMRVEGGQRDRNLGRAKKHITTAAKKGAQVILLPEAMDLGWTHPSALTEAQPITDGETSQFLSREAKTHGLYICAGLIEKMEENIYNSAILLNPDGQTILTHRKINELDIGRPYYDIGRKQNVCQTEYGRIGIIICADAKDHRLLEKPGREGVSVLLSPCSWAVPAGHDNKKTPYGQEWVDAYSPAAKKYAMWIAGCSNVGWMNAGPWRNYKGIGCSLIIDSKGEIAVQAPYGVEAEEIIYHTIELNA